MFRMSWMVKRAPISGLRAWLSQAVSGQIDAIGIVDDAVENRVGECRDSNHIVPAVDRNLAGDDERAFVVTVLDDFEEITGLFRREGFRPPIVEYQQFDASDGAQEPGVTRIAMCDRQIGEEPGDAGVENGHVFSASLVPERARQPTFAQAACPGYEQIAALGDPVAGGEFEKQGAIEPARDLIVDVFDAGGMTQASDPGARFELFLPAQRHFVFEQQAEPFRVIKAARLGFGFKFLEPLRQAVKPEGIQLVECRMSKHEDFLLMVVAGAAQIGVVEERRLAAVFGGRLVALLGKEGGDALAIERAEFEGSGRDGLDVGRIDAPIRA
jgi:hypothetical protein